MAFWNPKMVRDIFTDAACAIEPDPTQMRSLTFCGARDPTEEFPLEAWAKVLSPDEVGVFYAICEDWGVPFWGKLKDMQTIFAFIAAAAGDPDFAFEVQEGKRPDPDEKWLDPEAWTDASD